MLVFTDGTNECQYSLGKVESWLSVDDIIDDDGDLHGGGLVLQLVLPMQHLLGVFHLLHQPVKHQQSEPWLWLLHPNSLIIVSSFISYFSHYRAWFLPYPHNYLLLMRLLFANIGHQYLPTCHLPRPLPLPALVPGLTSFPLFSYLGHW
jgi:hypothetical protein